MKLASYVCRNFHDSDTDLFWYSENEDKQVFARKIEIYDGVIPSGNSAMAQVLRTLGVFLHHAEYTSIAEQMLTAMESRIVRYPAAYANWASITLSATHNQMVAVVGEHAVTLIRELKSKMLPQTLIFGSQKASDLPYFANRFQENKTLIYICSGTFCKSPVETVDEALALYRVQTTDL
jgi:uncharacterized protein YyaL (SSP411 family)